MEREFTRGTWPASGGRDGARQSLPHAPPTADSRQFAVQTLLLRVFLRALRAFAAVPVFSDFDVGCSMLDVGCSSAAAFLRALRASVVQSPRSRITIRPVRSTD